MQLDEGSLANQGDYEDENNIGCPKSRSCEMNPFNEFALCDIKEGEELVMRYGSFVEFFGDEFGF